MKKENKFHSAEDADKYMGIIWSIVYRSIKVPYRDKEELISHVLCYLIVLNKVINSTYIYKTTVSNILMYEKRGLNMITEQINEQKVGTIDEVSTDAIDIKMLREVEEFDTLEIITNMTAANAAKELGVSRRTVMNKKKELVHKFRNMLLLNIRGQEDVD